MRLSGKRVSRILLPLYAAAVAFLCFWDFGGIMAPPPCLAGIPLDKIAHFLMFLPLPLLCRFAYPPREGDFGHAARLALTVLCIGVLVAWGTEYLQGLSGWRTRSGWDFAADVIGLAAASAMILFYDFSRSAR